MDLTFSKKINPIRVVLGLCSLLNLGMIFQFGFPFLDANGPLPQLLALKLRHPSFLNYLPESVLKVFPYWWGSYQSVALVLHAILLLLFMANFRPKIVTILLFIYEYCLLVRMGLMVHGGHIFFLIILMIYILEDWLPEKKKWYASAIWISQFSLVYFFSGLYKDANLWFKTGEALQAFINLESLNNGVEPLQLGMLGIWLSRIVIPVEILGSITFLMLYFQKRANRKILFVVTVLLSTVHLGSFFLFSIFTFPPIGITIVIGISRAILLCQEQPLFKKILVFCCILPLFVLPYLGIEPDLLRVLPFRNKWTFFSRPPKVMGGVMIVKVKKDDEVLYTTQLDQSFHWTRYRFMVDEGFPEYKENRRPLTDYLCRTYKGDEVIWDSPTGIDQAVCDSQSDEK